MFYDPAALLAFIRFNFLLRRTLIELMHADLIAIRAAVDQLQGTGARTIDCHHAGLVGGEPLSKIRKIADEWKQPFQQEYTERTVSQAFENLLGLRADVEQALAKAASAAAQNGSKKISVVRPQRRPFPRSKIRAPKRNRKRQQKPLWAPRKLSQERRSILKPAWSRFGSS